MGVDFTIIGAGIVGLAIAHELSQLRPKASIVVVEKEASVALHQSGRNSGVIHSGVYYEPGSLKARFSRAGNDALVEFCRREEVPFERCGKLIAAAHEAEYPRLEALFERGRANGIDVRLLDSNAARSIEPHLRCPRALYVPSAGIVDFRQVAAHLEKILAQRGVRILLEAPVRSIRSRRDTAIVEAGEEEIEARHVVSCAGLHSDRVARLSGAKPSMKIIPFRGEYCELRESRRGLVRNMTYPVPDPRFPFLGVHLTRSIDGSVHAGPNAVLAFAREGYRWRDVRARDLLETLTYAPFLRFALANLRYGAKEIMSSLSRTVFAQAIQQLVPEIKPDDLMPALAGVRAQALDHNARLVDDFRIEQSGRVVHILNAPSPAGLLAELGPI